MTTKPVSTRIVVLLITTLLVAFPAKAATTIFGASVFSQTNVTDATSALGFPNGSAALVGVGGELVLQYSSPLTGENIASTFLDTGVVGALNVVALSIGGSLFSLILVQVVLSAQIWKAYAPVFRDLVVRF